ncbi:hypothetical protein BS47DRAFT_1367142 [Hydnum rufescens UP504]|uniref:Uncharacterized protein n=1 Tax=Hydnum rufescens UP504 TaxID=1448309 RepID=A0A9P6DPW7_9AGAM|nr:hypothetical protein BS47DRAFT_1367142 [Hydnum rufescens UP504]
MFTTPLLRMLWCPLEHCIIPISQNPSHGQAQDSCQILSTIHWRNILTFAPSLLPQGRYQPICQSFQYINQLPNAWLETYPSFAFYEGSMNVNGPWSTDALSQ